MSRMEGKLSKEADHRMEESRQAILQVMGNSMAEQYRSGGKDYGAIYGRLKAAVLIIPKCDPEEQQRLAKSCCHAAAEMIVTIVRTADGATINMYGAMLMAFGSYVEQEGKKGDQWRDESFTDLYNHLDHEIVEVGRSVGSTIRLHNAMDACSLAAILAAKLLFWL